MSAPNILSGAPWAVKIGGRDLHEFGVVITNNPAIGMAVFDAQQEQFPETPGVEFFGGAYGGQDLLLQARIFAETASECRSNLAALKRSLDTVSGSRHSRSAPIRLTVVDYADRYWPVVYQGPISVIPLDHPINFRVADLSIPLRVPTGYAVSNEPTFHEFSDAGEHWEIIDVGDGPVRPVVELKGASATPAFRVSNCHFHWRPLYTLDATYILGTKTGSTASPAASHFEPGDDGGRFEQQNSFATSWSGINANAYEGAYIIVVTPDFTYSAASNVWLFCAEADANNHVGVYYNAAQDNFVFWLKSGASNYVTAAYVDTETFAAGAETFVLAISFGADGMKLYKDGVLIASSAQTGGYAGSSVTVRLGEAAGASNPDATYHRLIGLPFQPSDDHMGLLCSKWRDFAPVVTLYTRSSALLGTERVILDHEAMTGTKCTDALSVTNDLNNWTAGNAFPPFLPPKAAFYIPSGSSFGEVKIHHRKLYL